MSLFLERPQCDPQECGKEMSHANPPLQAETTSEGAKWNTPNPPLSNTFFQAPSKYSKHLKLSSESKQRFAGSTQRDLSKNDLKLSEADI